MTAADQESATQTRPIALLVAAAASELRERADEVNRLNVFPVPDGDTGTNMALTMDAVVDELGRLPSDTSIEDICTAATRASLMGARGNSGVILSQIIRGLCEVAGTETHSGTELLAESLERATVVAFQAVRKPVEGTMLTVLRDASVAARAALDAQDDVDRALDRVIDAMVESVRRTPELLPVLKENGVVDAGGFGLAILAEGLLAASRGTEFDLAVVQAASAPAVHIVPVDDWSDDEYLYCTEFLLYGTALDDVAIRTFMSSVGGSELVVGDSGMLKVHVHTDDPAAVLGRALEFGEVAEVHVNNMRRQTAERAESLKSEAADAASRKAIGFIAVAAGDGLKEILRSLGIDQVVNGGQTMNPSTAELLDAVKQVNADSVIILPNNKNIHLAANQVIPLASVPVAVVPTMSVPESFAAMLAVDDSADLTAIAEAMTAAMASVRTGEVTTAVKDSTSPVGPIRKGQVIGITGDEIAVVGDEVLDVSLRLAEMIAHDGETLTLLGGDGISDEDLHGLAESISAAQPHLEVESHRGGQPLYPIIMSAE